MNEYEKKLVIDDKTYPDPFTLPKADFISESQNGMINWPPFILYGNCYKAYKYGLGICYIDLNVITKKEKVIDYSDVTLSRKSFGHQFPKILLYICIFKCKVTPSQRASYQALMFGQ